MIKLAPFIRLLVLAQMISTSFNGEHTKPKQSCSPLAVGNGHCELCEQQATCYNVNIIPNFEEFITVLEMHRNTIFELEATTFNHKKYTRLNLGNNSIRSIAKDTFSDLKELKVLDLSNNRILFLNENIFENNTELNRLYLQNNPDLNFSTHNLPQSLQILYLQNTNTFISISNLAKLRNLKHYKGKLCVNVNCTINLELEVTLCTHDTDSLQACVKETSTNCSNFLSESVGENKSYKNMETFPDHMKTLQDLATMVENIYKQIPKIENTTLKLNDSLYRINLSLTSLHNEVSDDIRKIHNEYYTVTTELRKITLELSNLNNTRPHFTWLYILLVIIVVLLVSILIFVI